MIQGEKLFPLAEAYEQESGYRPNPSTCHRHRLQGINGIKLETVKCGGRRMTSKEAVRRFFEAVTEATDGVACSSRTNRQREAAVAKAEIELDRAGI